MGSGHIFKMFCKFVNFVLFLSILSITECTIVVENDTLIVIDDNIEYEIRFNPENLIVVENHIETVTFNLSETRVGDVSGSTYEDVYILVETEDPHLAKIVGSDIISLSDILSGKPCSFNVSGVFLGRTRVKLSLNGSVSEIKIRNDPSDLSSYGAISLELSGGISLQNDGDTTRKRRYIDEISATASSNDSIWKPIPLTYKVAVIREERIIDTVFIAAVAGLVFFGNLGMGCKVDLNVVKEVLRRPIAPGIGFGCQYLIMPLTSFAVVKMLGLEGGVAFGLFAMGCAPGGSGSNMYTYLLNGDVSLSITMTAVSTLASLAMIPLWLYSLGRLITGKDANLHLPVQNIFISLVTLLIPITIGIVIRLKKPNVADKLTKCLKPFFLILILFMFSFGVYVNLYIFKLITPMLVVAGCLLPYIGFLLGGLVAFLFKQSWKRVVTIAIETALQNPGIPIILMKFSLGQPEADSSIVSPIVASMFTPIPLWVALIVLEIRKRCCKQKDSLDINVENRTDTNGDLPSPDKESELKLLYNDDSKTAGNVDFAKNTNGDVSPVDKKADHDRAEMDDQKTEDDQSALVNGKLDAGMP